METGEARSTSARMSGKGPELSVDIIHEAPGWDALVEDAALTAAARAACVAAGPVDRRCGVALLLTGDTEMRRLNAAWRGKDQPTNVLSFPQEASPVDGDIRHLGDIALALEAVTREAAERRIPPRQHAAHLVVHGMLHLLGYDHDHDAEAERMEALETEILRGLGLPDPYAEEMMPAGEVR